MRIAVLGANGQVGTELCLLLAQQPNVEVVPICRNRMGSAYLRSRGIRCRHGQPADAKHCAALYGDCHVVANLALVDTVKNPAWAREVNKALIDNVADTLGSRGKHIYFSTMSVYGDPEVGERFPIRNSYGQDKFVSENLAAAAGQRAGCPTYQFRLGHVSGDLQGITLQIRKFLRDGHPIRLPDEHRASNTVYVAAIVDAILKVGAGRVTPGIYDLMNVPQWTWRDVFEFEAKALGVVPSFERIPDRHATMDLRRLTRTALGPLMLWAAGNPLIKRVAGRITPKLPIERYRRLKATYAVKSAGAQIAQLDAPPVVLDAVYRRPVGKTFAAALAPTAQLLALPEYRLGDLAFGAVWADDLPPAA